MSPAPHSPHIGLSPTGASTGPAINFQDEGENEDVDDVNNGHYNNYNNDREKKIYCEKKKTICCIIIVLNTIYMPCSEILAT